MVQKAFNLSSVFEEQLSEKFITELNILESEWRKITFRPEFADYLEQGSKGIYIITLTSGFSIEVKPPFRSFFSPVYIGHSTRLRRRFLAHSTGSYAGALWKTLQKFPNQVEFHYKLLPTTSVKDLKLLEQELLNIYGPPINKINSQSARATLRGSLTC